MTRSSYTVWPWLVVLFFYLSVFPASVRAATVNAANLDSDGDGIRDTWEINVYHTDPWRADSDGDGFSDRDEIVHGFNPLGPGRLVNADTDGDHLSDRLELEFGSDPTVIDTDGDGHSDGEEAFAGFSPTSSVRILLVKSIFIDLTTQRLEQRVANIPITSFPISAGLPRTPTPAGTFKVLQKSPRAWSRMAGLWMPYWMSFSGRGHGIHELPEWPGGKKEGQNHLGHPASHGCVRMGVGVAKRVYEWSPIGTPVVIAKR